MSTSNLAYTFDTRFAVSVLSFHVGLKTNKNEATNTPLTTPSIDRYNWENQVMFEILHTNSIHIFCCVLKMNIHAFICIVKLKRSSYKKESVFFNTYGESCLFFFSFGFNKTPSDFILFIAVLYSQAFHCPCSCDSMYDYVGSANRQ